MTIRQAFPFTDGHELCHVSSSQAISKPSLSTCQALHPQPTPFHPLLPQSLLPRTPVMCRYTVGWFLFHDRLLLPGAETHLIVNIWAITIAN